MVFEYCVEVEFHDRTKINTIVKDVLPDEMIRDGHLVIGDIDHLTLYSLKTISKLSFLALPSGE